MGHFTVKVVRVRVVESSATLPVSEVRYAKTKTEISEKALKGKAIASFVE